MYQKPQYRKKQTNKKQGKIPICHFEPVDRKEATLNQLKRETLGCTENRNTVKNKQTNKKQGKIPIRRVENRRNTDTAVKIGHAYLKLYPSRVFVFSQACIHEKSTSAIAARKRETSI